jgi:formylglycine-generating enzyme required for sulfatase activity
MPGPAENHLSRLAATVGGVLRAPAASRPVPVKTWTSLPGRNSLGNVLATVPADRLPSGSPAGMSLAVSTTAVSNADYLAFVRAGGPEPRGNPNRPTQRTWIGRHCPDSALDHPVIYVSHADAVMFCGWLTEKERDEGRITVGQRYVLPTLPQWLACVRGDRVPRDAILDRRWESGGQPTVPVTWGEAGALGLMHAFGNVFEWCADEQQSGGEPHNPLVGGGWASAREWLAEQVRKGNCGAIWRRHGLPMKDGGFRVCLLTQEDTP